MLGNRNLVCYLPRPKPSILCSGCPLVRPCGLARDPEQLCTLDTYLVYSSILSKACKITYCLALWVRFSADDILKYFFLFSQKTGFDISCNWYPMFVPTPLFSKKKNINLSSKLAQRVVKVNIPFSVTCPNNNSHCVLKAPGKMECLCNDGYYGYKCLRQVNQGCGNIKFHYLSTDK